MLFLPGIIYCEADSIDARAQRRIRNDPSVPDRSDKLVLAYDSIAVANQIL